LTIHGFLHISGFLAVYSFVVSQYKGFGINKKTKNLSSKLYTSYNSIIPRYLFYL